MGWNVEEVTRARATVTRRAPPFQWILSLLDRVSSDARITCLYRQKNMLRYVQFVHHIKPLS